MKKLLVSALLASTALGAMTAANATHSFGLSDVRPYVGVDYKYLEGFDSGALKGLVEDQTSLLGVTAGLQFNDYIGFEVSYAKAVQDLGKGPGLTTTGQVADTTTNPATIYDVSQNTRVDKFNFSHFTAGVTAQYPLADKIYAKALIGAAWQKGKVKATSTLTASTVDPTTGLTVSGSQSVSDSASDSNNGVFLGKVGIGYQMSKSSVVEVNYTREDTLNGLGLQYKYLF